MSAFEQDNGHYGQTAFMVRGLRFSATSSPFTSDEHLLTKRRCAVTILEWSEILGNFGEFFGAIAVVFTLIYLSVQIRSSSEFEIPVRDQRFFQQDHRQLLE